MELIEQLTIADIVSVFAVFTALYSGYQKMTEIVKEIKKPIDEINEKLDKQGRATQASLRYILDRVCTTYIAKGYCSPAEKKALKEDYDAYAGVGGDSFITMRVNKCLELPDEKIRKGISNDEN